MNFTLNLIVHQSLRDNNIKLPETKSKTPSIDYKSLSASLSDIFLANLKK